MVGSDDLSQVSNKSVHEVNGIECLDLTDDTTDIAILAGLTQFDMVNSKLRAHQFFNLQYPANNKGIRVLSFYFGIRAIILGCLNVPCIEFDMLSLVADRDLFNTCLKTVEHILTMKRLTGDTCVNDLNAAFNVLRDKHITSVICKVLLLPLICCWFPDIGEGAYVMMKSTPVNKKHSDVMVKVIYMETGGRYSFMDIEKVDDTVNCCIDYFYKH